MKFSTLEGARAEKFGRCFLFPLLPFFRPFTRLNSVPFSLLSLVFELLGSLIEWISHEFLLISASISAVR